MYICYLLSHVYKSVISFFCERGTRFVKSSPNINTMLQNVVRKSKRKIQETNMYAKRMQSTDC